MWKVGLFTYQECKMNKLKMFVFILLPAHGYFLCKNKLVSSIIAPKRIIQPPEVCLLGL